MDVCNRQHTWPTCHPTQWNDQFRKGGKGWDNSVIQEWPGQWWREQIQQICRRYNTGGMAGAPEDYATTQRDCARLKNWDDRNLKMFQGKHKVLRPGKKTSWTIMCWGSAGWKATPKRRLLEFYCINNWQGDISVCGSQQPLVKKHWQWVKGSDPPPLLSTEGTGFGVLCPSPGPPKQ